MNSPCTHTGQIKDLPTDKDLTVCEECIKTDDEWISLRQCLTCGHVGCCNSSKNKHATKHFEETNHPIMKSLTQGEDFSWCFIDGMYL